MSRLRCSKCNSNVKLDTYTVCRSCGGVDLHKEVNPLSLLDEDKIDVLLMLLQDEDKRSNKRLSKYHVDLFVMALKAKINKLY